MTQWAHHHHHHHLQQHRHHQWWFVPIRNSFTGLQSPAICEKIPQTKNSKKSQNPDLGRQRVVLMVFTIIRKSRDIVLWEWVSPLNSRQDQFRTTSGIIGPWEIFPTCLNRTIIGFSKIGWARSWSLLPPRFENGILAKRPSSQILFHISVFSIEIVRILCLWNILFLA